MTDFYGNHNGQFEYRATGVLGNKRETMLRNQLHVRPELAKAVKRGFEIPNNMTFGKTTFTGDGGVPEAINNWTGQYGNQYVFNHPKVRHERDFVGLNKGAVDSGCLTAKEQGVYRTMHDMKRQILPENVRNTSGFKPKRIPLNMTYGMPTRPPTPLWDLIEHKYQDKWIQQRRMMEAQFQQETSTKKKALLKPQPTRTSLLRMYEVPMEPGPLWKIPKFVNKAKPRIETFRSKSDLGAAMRYDQSDRIPRQGTEFHHGIIEPAKS